MALQGPAHLRSVDLIAELRKEAKTPEQQQLITDLFEKITIYDLKVADAKTKKDATGWTTTITVKADKFYASGKGVETQHETRRADRDRPVHRAPRPRRLFVEGRDHDGARADRERNQEIIVHSAKKPAFAGVDPYNYYIDRNSDDNVKEVTS